MNRSRPAIPATVAGVAPTQGQAVHAQAQPTESVVIIGTRASGESAAERKRRSQDILDGIVAAEINRLPDLGGADADIVGLGAFQATTASCGWLDASLRWQVTERRSWSLDGGNLLGTMRRSYFGVETRPQNALVNDRQFGTSLSLRM
jgi:hypothetical protein